MFELIDSEDRLRELIKTHGHSKKVPAYLRYWVLDTTYANIVFRTYSTTGFTLMFEKDPATKLTYLIDVWPRYVIAPYDRSKGLDVHFFTEILPLLESGGKMVLEGKQNFYIRLPMNLNRADITKYLKAGLTYYMQGAYEIKIGKN